MFWSRPGLFYLMGVVLCAHPGKKQTSISWFMKLLLLLFLLESAIGWKEVLPSLMDLQLAERNGVLSDDGTIFEEDRFRVEFLLFPILQRPQQKFAFNWFSSRLKSYLHLLESVKLLDSQSCCFCQAFSESFNIAFAFWADDMPQWIDLPKDWGCETFLPFADKMLLTHHMCLMNIQHGRMSRFFSSPDKQESTTSYLTLTGSDHSLGCSWNKLTACQLVVWFFYRRHAAVSHLGCFIGGLWTRTPISSHVKQLDWDELGKIDSISQASPMMVETISIFKDFKDYSQYTSKNQVNFLKTNVKINQDYINKMKSLKDSFNQHTQDMGVVTGRSVFRIFISGDWSRRQVIVPKKNHRPSAASGSFLLRPTRIDIWKSNEWMEPWIGLSIQPWEA